MQLTPIGHPRFYVDLALEVWPQAHWPELLNKIQELGVYGVRTGAGLWGRLEPDLTEYRFDYLIKFLDLAERAGLQVILQNPTNLPPHWVYERFEDLLPIDAHGQKASLWSTNRICYAHLNYRQLATHFMSAMVQSVANHKAVGGWQVRASHTDLDGMLSYSHEAQEGFRRWLARRYRSIERLNFAWGLVQNSAEYLRFSNIEIPNRHSGPVNPAPLMDFFLFSARQREEFVQGHIAAIRAVSQLAPISVGFDGLSELSGETPGSAKSPWLDMALAPLRQDAGAALDRLSDIALVSAKARDGKPGFGSITLNVAPKGERQWSVNEHRARLWQALGGGTKQIFLGPIAQPQIGDTQGETGLFHLDGSKTPAGEAVASVTTELGQLDPQVTDHLEGRGLRQADIAIIYDMASAWAHKIQPLVDGFDYDALISRFFSAVQGLGLEADIISQATPDLSGYKAVFVPGMISWTPEFLTQLQKFEGPVIVGPRTGTRTPEFHIVGTLGPNLLPDWLDLKVLRIDGLGQVVTEPVKGGGAFEVWREDVATDRKIVWRTNNGAPAYVEQGRFSYLCGIPDEKLARRLVLHVMDAQKVQTTSLPDGVITRRLDPETSLYLNMSAKRVDLKRRGLTGAFHLDGARLDPSGICLVIDKPGPVSQAVAQVEQAMTQPVPDAAEEPGSKKDVPAEDGDKDDAGQVDTATPAAEASEVEASKKPAPKPRLNKKVAGKAAAVRRKAANKVASKAKKVNPAKSTTTRRRKTANGTAKPDEAKNHSTANSPDTSVKPTQTAAEKADAATAEVPQDSADKAE